MKSWGEIILSQNIFAPLCNVLEISPRIPAVGSFLGGDSGPQDRRLQAFQAEDFGPEPEIPAIESSLPNLDFCPSGASLCFWSGVSTDPGRRLYYYAH
jgi:hypothetical protein